MRPWLKSIAKNLFGQPSKQKRKKATRRGRLFLEPLEPRIVPSVTLTVNSNADTVNVGAAALTLREAVMVVDGQLDPANLQAKAAQIQKDTNSYDGPGRTAFTC